MTRTILVVDDEKRLCDLVRAYLTQEGFRVVTATNGQEALYVARREKPDLILLDLMMPEMSGFEFMHAYAREGDTPIIILTAKLEEQD
jgi:DNA-binding response OmpR family regulator